MKTCEKWLTHTNTTDQWLRGLLCSLLLATPALAQNEAGESPGNLTSAAQAGQLEAQDANTSADPAPVAVDLNNPILGTWELNVGLSVYSGRGVQAPRKQTRIYSPHPDGVEATAVTVSANGQETRTDYTAGFDGVPHPVRGLANSDAIKVERRNRYLSVATFLHAGIPAGTSERAVSPDGQRLTITLVIGGEVISKSVYDRVE